MEGKKYIEKPSTSKVMLYCENCNSSNEHFLTNLEIRNKIIRKAWCSICNKITNWSINQKEEKAMNRYSTTKVLEDIFEFAKKEKLAITAISSDVYENGEEFRVKFMREVK